MKDRRTKGRRRGEYWEGGQRRKGGDGGGDEGRKERRLRMRIERKRRIITERR
jgi:hypothetical protein